jgi:hypothetical protein
MLVRDFTAPIFFLSRCVVVLLIVLLFSVCEKCHAFFSTRPYFFFGCQNFSGTSTLIHTTSEKKMSSTTCILCLDDVDIENGILPCQACKTIVFHKACWDASVRAGYGKRCMVCRNELPTVSDAPIPDIDVINLEPVVVHRNPTGPFLVLHELTAMATLVALIIRGKSSEFAITCLVSVTVGVGVCALIDGCASQVSCFRGHILVTAMISSFITWLLFVVNVLYEPEPASIVYAVWSTMLLGAMCGMFESFRRRLSRIVPL